MHKNKNKKLIISKVLIILSVSIFLFSASARPAYAFLGFGDITFSTTIADIPGKLLDIFNKIRAGAGARAYHQALRSVTYKLAQDSAVWLASGGKGRKPLVFQQSWSERLSDFGDQVAGKFLVNMSQGAPINLCSPTSVNSRLKLTIGVSNSIKDFDIFPENDIDRDTGKTGCKLSDIGNNFQKSYENQKTALKNLSKGFDLDSNELGSFLVLREYVQKEKNKAEEEERLAREQSSIKALEDPITKKTKTPAPLIEETQKSNLRKALEQEAVITGDIFVDAFQIFANTMAQTYLKRLQKGMLNPSSTRSPGSIVSSIEGSPSSRAALLAEYDVFSPERALNISSPGEINLFAEMSSCPQNQYQTPYNCLLSDNLQQAIQQGLTVSQAMEAGLIDRNMIFPEKHNSEKPLLSEYNLKKLRFLRVIPVGWEIAAKKISDSSKQVRFSKLLECFDGTDTADDCAGLDHLVDPQWILSLPQQYCKAQGYSTIPEYENSPNRKEMCVDLQSCIKEDSSGRCIDYGYCTRERNTWQINGDSCEAQFATCKTFSKPDNTNFSVLT